MLSQMHPSPVDWGQHVEGGCELDLVVDVRDMHNFEAQESIGQRSPGRPNPNPRAFAAGAALMRGWRRNGLARRGGGVRSE
ncbi:hypothetical protein PR202_gb29558 [Eleusine coracana subsp. coracana]|uniref:Uncharacterized protein n=1 Tax=Eleusine coracana subsp. coracana TaxID=191504 RepID=A0AAV5FZC6_ELECO|nr:hypothetical protein PR202_gb29558 [Eleusine coracana subsp. coracana]